MGDGMTRANAVRQVEQELYEEAVRRGVPASVRVEVSVWSPSEHGVRVSEVDFFEPIGEGGTGTSFMAVDPEAGGAILATERRIISLMEGNDQEEAEDCRWRMFVNVLGDQDRVAPPA